MYMAFLLDLLLPWESYMTYQQIEAMWSGRGEQVQEKTNASPYASDCAMCADRCASGFRYQDYGFSARQYQQLLMHYSTVTKHNYGDTLLRSFRMPPFYERSGSWLIPRLIFPSFHFAESESERRAKNAHRRSNFAKCSSAENFSVTTIKQQ